MKHLDNNLDETVFTKLIYLFSFVKANNLHTPLFGLLREETEAGEGQ